MTYDLEDAIFDLKEEIEHLQRRINMKLRSMENPMMTNSLQTLVEAQKRLKKEMDKKKDELRFLKSIAA